jgi:hypothetical protein
MMKKCLSALKPGLLKKRFGLVSVGVAIQVGLMSSPALADLQSTLTTGLGKYEQDILGSIQKVGVIGGGVLMTGLCIWLFFAQEKKKVFFAMGFVVLGLVLMGLGPEIAKVFSPA